MLLGGLVGCSSPARRAADPPVTASAPAPVSAPAPATSQIARSPVPVFADEPAARALYNKMIEAMRQAESLSYQSDYRRHRPDKRYMRDCTYTVWMKKPNQFRVETLTSKGKRGGVLIGDGDHLWIHWPGGRPYFSADPSRADNETRRKSYMKERTPIGRHSIGHKTGILGAGMGMPIIDPSTFHGYTDSLQRYIDGFRSLGTETIDGEECDGVEVSIMKGQRSWYLWLSKRDHLPRRLKQIVRVSFDLIMHETWSKVTFNAQIPDEKFVWAPPEGWKQWRLPDPAERLLKPGRAAPEFELASADGGKIKLSDFRGKVVWLYIWRSG